MVNFRNRFHTRRATLNYVGIVLHKKTITIHVVDEQRKKVDHKRLTCLPTAVIVDYFRQLGPFQAVIEAPKIGGQSNVAGSVQAYLERKSLWRNIFRRPVGNLV